MLLHCSLGETQMSIMDCVWIEITPANNFDELIATIQIILDCKVGTLRIFCIVCLKSGEFCNKKKIC